MSITGRTYLEHGRPVVVVTQWQGKGPRNVAIRREDGTVVVRPFRGLRRPGNPQVQEKRAGASMSPEAGHAIVDSCRVEEVTP